MTDDVPILTDTKDWTWTLERRCPQCGVAAGEVLATDLVAALERSLVGWPQVALREGAAVRRDRARWSDLEYACHVRDVCTVFAKRLQLIRDQHDPLFADWDQDKAARDGQYAQQSPSDVAAELARAAARLVAEWSSVQNDEWERTGRRSDGSRFTALTLGQYCLHDVVHHGYDVGVGG